MYSDVEQGVRFLTQVPVEGGNLAIDLAPPIDHENPPIHITINNADSAISATNEVGILPPVDYSIAAGGYVLSNMLYTGPPASAHAQAMCCNRTGNLVFWLEATLYSGAGALNIANLRVMRSKDFGRTREPASDIDVLSGATVNGSVGITDSVFVVNPRNLCCNHDGTVLVIPFKYGVGISYDLGYTYTWKRLTTAAENYFSAGQYICCSESGQYIYVLGRGGSHFYRSSDAGVSFQAFPVALYSALVSSLQAGETIIDADKEVSGLCCSRDGRMVAAVQRVTQQNGARTPNYRGKIYLSFNFGGEFLARTIYDCSMVYTWEFGGIAMSESGQNIIIGHNNSFVSGANDSRLHMSTDYGATFKTLLNNATTGLRVTKFAVNRIRSNADCKHIWIQSEDSRYMAYSSNYGESWNEWTLSQEIGSRNYDGLCLSAWGDHVYYIYNSSIRRLEMLMLLSGIASASNMGFDTAGSRRMTILSDGKVGINKTDPEQQLDVAGNVMLRGNLLLPDDNQRDIGVVNGNALKSMSVHSAYCKSIQVHSATGGDVGTSAKPFNVVYNKRVALTNGGSAATALDQITFGYGNATDFTHSIKTRHNNPGDANNAMEFYVHKPSAGVGATNNTLTLTATGATINGTSAPLTVVGTAYPAITLKDQTNLSDSLDIMRDHAANKNIIRSTSRIDIEAPANYPRLVCLTNGNNGINTSNPTTALDVTGVLTMRGNILPDSTNSYRNIGGNGVSFSDVWAFNIKSKDFPMTFATGSTVTEKMRISNVANEVQFSATLLPDATANDRDLGATGQRFRDIYLVNQPSVTSDGQDKKDVTPLDSPHWLSIVSKLRPVSYKLIKNESDRTHTGFISQQVLEDIGFELADRWGFYIKGTVEVPVEPVQETFAGEKRKRDETQEVNVGELLGEEEKKDGYEPVVEEVVEDVVEEDVEDVADDPMVPPPALPTVTKEVYGLRYTELIAPLVACVQELNKRILLQQEQIAQLATQIAELKQGSAL